MGEIVDAGLKSRRCLIQSGMVIACVARGSKAIGGVAADYISGLRGVSQSSPLVRVPIRLSLPTYLTQPFL